MNDIIYSSTRGAAEKLTASQAILKGLASDGGLFVPDHIPALDKSLEELSKEYGKDYLQIQIKEGNDHA